MEETTNETLPTENISTISDQVEYLDVMVGSDYFDDAISNLSINDHLYCIVVTDDSGLRFTFPVPNAYVSSLFVIDGQLYNLGKEKITLCTNLSADDYYYRILEIPVYGSEEYYENISMEYQGQMWGDAVAPYRMYGVTPLDQDHRDQIITEAIMFENPTYEIVGSTMNAWSLESIFLFIILVILVGRSVFRKGWYYVKFFKWVYNVLLSQYSIFTRLGSSTNWLFCPLFCI